MLRDPGSEPFLIVFPDPAPLPLNGVPLLKLSIQECGEKIGEQVARSRVDPRILVHLSTEKPAPVGPFFTYDFRPLYQPFFVENERSPLSAEPFAGTRQRARARCLRPRQARAGGQSS